MAHITTGYGHGQGIAFSGETPCSPKPEDSAMNKSHHLTEAYYDRQGII